MSSKLGFILSLVFVAIFFMFGIDLITVQFVYSDLDAKSTMISYKISSYGTIDDTLVNYIENKYNVSFTCLSNCTPMFGDEVQYVISKTIKPIIISKDEMNLSLKRFAVIGYYG